LLVADVLLYSGMFRQHAVLGLGSSCSSSLLFVPASWVCRVDSMSHSWDLGRLALGDGEQQTAFEADYMVSLMCNGDFPLALTHWLTRSIATERVSD
jgi:hypothetical protein